MLQGIGGLFAIAYKFFKKQILEDNLACNSMEIIV